MGENISTFKRNLEASEFSILATLDTLFSKNISFLAHTDKLR